MNIPNYFHRNLLGKSEYLIYNEINQYIENFLIKNSCNTKIIEEWRSNINQDDFLTLINENIKWKRLHNLKNNLRFLFKKGVNYFKFLVLKLINYNKNKKTDQESPTLKLYVNNDELTEIPLTTKLEQQKSDISLNILPLETKEENKIITGWEELGFSFEKDTLSVSEKNGRFNFNFFKRDS
tara:strand:+ start:887 stop:1432 length:546 start_codon:yes stop_codon:yes gene_type:complete